MLKRPIHKLGFATVAIMIFAGIATTSQAENSPTIVVHENIEWKPMGDSGMEMALLAGDPKTAEPYSFMIKVPKGTRIPPHSHSDAWRHSTIISGTLLWAFGDTFDEAEMIALTPGSFWTEPSGANHYGWAKDSDVLAMGTGMGPSSTTPVASSQ